MLLNKMTLCQLSFAEKGCKTVLSPVAALGTFCDDLIHGFGLFSRSKKTHAHTGTHRHAHIHAHVYKHTYKMQIAQLPRHILFTSISFKLNFVLFFKKKSTSEKCQDVC